MGTKGGYCKLLIGFRFGQFDIVEAFVFMEFVEVDRAFDAGYASCLGMLPNGESGRWISGIIGYENLVVGIFLSTEMVPIDLFAGINDWFYTVFQLHELENLIDAGLVQVASMNFLDIEDGDEVLLAFLDYCLEVGKLLIGGCFSAIEVVAANEESCFFCVFDIGFVVGVLNGGAFGSFDVDKFNCLVGSDLGPVDGTLVFRDIDAPCLGNGDAEAERKDQQDAVAEVLFHKDISSPSVLKKRYSRRLYPSDGLTITRFLYLSIHLLAIEKSPLVR